MQLQESSRFKAMVRQQRTDSRMGFQSRDQNQTLLGRRGLQSNAAKRIQIAFDRMAWRCSRETVVMREAGAPQPVARRQVAGDSVAWPQQSGEPGASRVLRQMDDEIVAAAPKRCEELPFGFRLAKHARALPAAING